MKEIEGQEGNRITGRQKGNIEREGRAERNEGKNKDRNDITKGQKAEMEWTEGNREAKLTVIQHEKRRKKGT